jgi:3-hydroxymyristoyl/3-hydroxydecanoyl-(acyl carrier protein) dehydratase
MMATSPAKIKEYPEPLALHEVVVKDSSVFWDTLRRFHSIMSTKFMIPVIGGKELDLHVLYVEVTRRGGYEKVNTFCFLFQYRYFFTLW